MVESSGFVEAPSVADQSGDWQLEVDLGGSDSPPQGGARMVRDVPGGGCEEGGFNIEIDLGDADDVIHPVEPVGSGKPTSAQLPVPHPARPAQMRGWSLPFNAPRPRPQEKSRPLPTAQARAGFTNPRNQSQTAQRSADGLSQEVKERAAAIAAANRGRGFKSRMGCPAKSSIFMDPPKPKQNIGLQEGVGRGGTYKTVAEKAQGLSNWASDGKPMGHVDPGVPRKTQMMSHEEAVERRDSQVQEQQEAEAPAGKKWWERGAQGAPGSMTSSVSRNGSSRKPAAAPAWPCFPAAAEEEASASGTNDESATGFDSPATAVLAKALGEEKGRRNSRSSIKRVPKKALQRAYADEGPTGDTDTGDPVEAANPCAGASEYDAAQADGAAHEGDGATAVKPRESASTAAIRETPLSGWNKEAAKNPFISERSLQKNEEFKQQVQRRRERAGEAALPGRPLEMGAVMRSLQSKGLGKENAGSERQAVVDLTEDEELSPPPERQHAFRSAPEPPTVLSDDSGGSMDWEDDPPFASRNGAQDQRHARDGSGNDEPWWHRFPDFVPVDALTNGFNPRTRCRVYIDYKAQFREEVGTGVGGRSRTVPTKKQEGKAKKPFKRGGGGFKRRRR